MSIAPALGAVDVAAASLPGREPADSLRVGLAFGTSSTGVLGLGFTMFLEIMGLLALGSMTATLGESGCVLPETRPGDELPTTGAVETALGSSDAVLGAKRLPTGCWGGSALFGGSLFATLGISVGLATDGALALGGSAFAIVGLGALFDGSAVFVP